MLLKRTIGELLTRIEREAKRTNVMRGSYSDTYPCSSRFTTYQLHKFVHPQGILNRWVYLNKLTTGLSARQGPGLLSGFHSSIPSCWWVQPQHQLSFTKMWFSFSTRLAGHWLSKGSVVWVVCGLHLELGMPREPSNIPLEHIPDTFMKGVFIMARLACSIGMLESWKTCWCSVCGNEPFRGPLKGSHWMVHPDIPILIPCL